MSVKLTKKQKLLLDFLSEFLKTHDYSPSYREIAAGMGLKSVASVAEHIDNLVAVGAIRKAPGMARSLEVVDLSFPETTALFKSRMLGATEEEAEVLRKAAEILGVELD